MKDGDGVQHEAPGQEGVRDTCGLYQGSVFAGSVRCSCAMSGLSCSPHNGKAITFTEVEAGNGTNARVRVLLARPNQNFAALALPGSSNRQHISPVMLYRPRRERSSSIHEAHGHGHATESMDRFWLCKQQP